MEQAEERDIERTVDAPRLRLEAAAEANKEDANLLNDIAERVEAHRALTLTVAELMIVADGRGQWPLVSFLPIDKAGEALDDGIPVQKGQK